MTQRGSPPALVEQFQYGLDAPICLTWELTYACNLSCVHCLSSSGRTDTCGCSCQGRSRSNAAPACVSISTAVSIGTASVDAAHAVDGNLFHQ